MPVEHGSLSENEKEISTARELFLAGVKRCNCAFCRAPCYLRESKKGLISLALMPGYVHTNPICQFLRAGNRYLNLNKVDIDKIFEKIKRGPKKGGGGGGGTRPPVEPRDPDDAPDQIIIPQTAAALVKIEMHNYADISVGDREHLHQWFINAENLHMVESFHDLGAAFVIAEPWDFHSRQRCIQLRVSSDVPGVADQIMINVYYTSWLEFKKAKEKLFFKRDDANGFHNIPKYSSVLVFGDWKFSSLTHPCAERCRLYRRKVRCTSPACRGLIWTTATNTSFITTIPSCRLTRASAEQLFNKRKGR